MTRHKLNFETSHHQFYILDKGSPFRTDSDNFWTQEATDDRLALEDGLLGVGTECYGEVRGDLQVLESASNEPDLSVYDHIVEGSLNLKSGILQVFPCLDTTPALELELPPNTYRVRVYSSNLASVIRDSGDDYYVIKIWPEAYRGREVLKR
jgi:hypothetical protein